MARRGPGCHLARRYVTKVSERMSKHQIKITSALPPAGIGRPMKAEMTASYRFERYRRSMSTQPLTCGSLDHLTFMGTL
jgi:hypothetical protein